MRLVETLSQYWLYRKRTLAPKLVLRVGWIFGSTAAAYYDLYDSDIRRTYSLPFWSRYASKERLLPLLSTICPKHELTQPFGSFTQLRRICGWGKRPTFSKIDFFPSICRVCTNMLATASTFRYDKKNLLSIISKVIFQGMLWLSMLSWNPYRCLRCGIKSPALKAGLFFNWVWVVKEPTGFQPKISMSQTKMLNDLPFDVMLVLRAQQRSHRAEGRL